MKLKDEVGMAGSKSTQTRFVGIITSTIHPYACFCRLSCTYNLLSALDLNVGEIVGCFCTSQKAASVGMYSGCDYPYKSCLCTF